MTETRGRGGNYKAREAEAQRHRRHLLGWAGIAATIVLTLGLMALLSATGVAKSPAGGTLEAEESGSDTAPVDTPVTPPAGATTIDVTLNEWKIVPSTTTAKAGTVTFNVKNVGPANSHEFIILKTDLAPDALPTARDGSINESGRGITSPGESREIPVGKSQTVTVRMTPGNYIFVDNIVERGLVHWTKKAYGTFTVTP
jgi:uncharacterized cupredoxin-like copper-binding protein